MSPVDPITTEIIRDAFVAIASDMNDSYMTGTHLNDSTIIMPIFWRGTRVGFAASRARWLDVGAKDPGTPVDSHEIYQEGTHWGPTRHL